MAFEGHHASKSLSVRIVDQLSTLSLNNRLNSKRSTITSRASKPSQASLKSEDQPTVPHPADLARYLPWLCQQFRVRADLVRVYHGVYFSGNSSNMENKMSVPTVFFDDGPDNEVTQEQRVPWLDLRVIAHFNRRLRLSEIVLDKNKQLPAFVIGIIATVLQHHIQCNKITINKGLDSHSVKEIKDMLDIVTVKDLCFDGMPVSNYHILLDNSTPLQHLSLARCKINDKYVKIIAEKLTYPAAASKSLCALNLSSNHITDVGVKYLADALRSNRQLYYINLADNDITDDGTAEIFKILMEFPLTQKEIDKTTPRHNANKENNLSPAKHGGKSPKSKTRKKIIIKPVKKKIKSRKAIDKHRPSSPEYTGPFESKQIVVKDGSLYSVGNNSLCYINMAYNKYLTAFTAKMILETLKYQANWTHGGLKMVNIEGCRFIRPCPELEEIDAMLMKNILKMKPKAKSKVRLN